MKLIIKNLLLIYCLFTSFNSIGGPLEKEIRMIQRQFSCWEYKFESSIPTLDSIEEAHTYLNSLREQLDNLLLQCSDPSDEEQINQLISTINERDASLSNPTPFSKAKTLLDKAKEIYKNPRIRCHNPIKVLNFQQEELNKILNALNQMLEDTPQEGECPQILESISIVNNFIQELNSSLIKLEIENKIDASGIAYLRRGTPTLNQISNVRDHLKHTMQELELAIQNEKRTRDRIELIRLKRSLRSDISFTEALSQHIQNPTQESAKMLEQYTMSHSAYISNILEKTGFREPCTRDNPFNLIGGPLEREIRMMHRQFCRWERRFESSIPTPDSIEEAHTYLNSLREQLDNLLLQCSDSSDEEQINQLISTINKRISSLPNPVPISKTEILLEKANKIYHNPPRICCRNPKLAAINEQKEELEKILGALNQMLEDTPQKEEQSQILKAISIVNDFIQKLNHTSSLEEIQDKIQACNLSSLKAGTPSLEQIADIRNRLNKVLPELQLAIKNEQNARTCQKLERLERSLKSDIRFTQALSEHIQNLTQESAKKLECYESSHRWYVINILEKTGFRKPRTRGNGGPLENEIRMMYRQFSRWERSFDRDIPTPKTIQEAGTTLNTLLEQATSLLPQCSNSSDEEQITQLISTINEKISSLSHPVPISKTKVLLEKAKEIYKNPDITCHNPTRVLKFQQEELEKIVNSLNQSLEDSSQEEEHSQILEAISIVNNFIKNLNSKTTLEDIRKKIKDCDMISLRSGTLTLEKIEKVKTNLKKVYQELDTAIKNERDRRNSRELERIIGGLGCDIDFTNTLSKHIQNPTQKSAKLLEDLYEIAYAGYVHNALIQTGFREPRTRGNR